MSMQNNLQQLSTLLGQMSQEIKNIIPDITGIETRINELEKHKQKTDKLTSMMKEALNDYSQN